MFAAQPATVGSPPPYLHQMSKWKLPGTLTSASVTIPVNRVQGLTEVFRARHSKKSHVAA